MVSAYVLINFKSGIPAEVIKEIREIPEVKTARLVTGLHDAISYVEVAELKYIGDLAVDKLRAIPEVGSTVTCLTVEG